MNRSAATFALIASLLVLSCGSNERTATPTTPPTASFTVSPASGTTETDFAFDASASSDAEDAASVLRVRWDWESDGTWDTDYSTAKTAMHRYATAGSKAAKHRAASTVSKVPARRPASAGTMAATLEVLDSDGMTATKTDSVVVAGLLACSIATVALGGDAPLDEMFEAAVTGGTAPYEFGWTFGDGEESSVQNPAHVYALAGSYIAVLTVTDAGTPRQTCRDSVQIIVTPVFRRDSPASLLTSWFEAAYASHDSVLYEEMLDAAFRFEFLPEDAESLVLLDGFWGKASDLASTGHMFRSQNVGDITLDFVVMSDVAYSGGDCVECRELATVVSLQVVTNPQSIDPLVLEVNSPQGFVVKKDPADTTRWVLFRQVDMTLFSAVTPATEEISWGQIKGLFQ